MYMLTISLKNHQILDKNSLTTACSYAQFSGIYYNKDEFNKATDNVVNSNSVYDSEKYVFGKETTVKNGSYVNYEGKSKKNKGTKSKFIINVINGKSNIQKSNTIQNNIINDNNEETSHDNDILYLNGWAFFNSNKELRPNNFGDDINFSFLPNITEKTHKKYNNELITNYLIIGSIFIDKYVNKYTEIWGAGMLKYKLLNNKPNKIYAVRGPKTREICIQSGLECPEIYGDPALLIPYYYQPYVLKKYKLGIIPHHSHIKSYLINKFKNNNDIKIINFTKYNDWKDIIKEIVECEFIVSESLHGLIIAESYKIPNIWISIGTNIDQNLKYEDFFLSINKPYYDSYLIDVSTTYEDLLLLKEKYNSSFNIDLQKLVNACPIKLKHLNLYNYPKQYNGKILLCCIGKMENNYIREFVEHYKNIGFDNIVLYDNNDINGEHFEDVIDDYIKSGYVILKDIRGKQLAQIPSYTDCYNTYKDEYDWIAYFDIDEYLDLNCNDIHEFLSNDMYNDRGINTIRICWKQFTDSNLLKVKNNDYSIKRFTEYLPITYPYTALTKIIIKTCLPSVTFDSAHGILKDNRIICVNTEGKLTNNSIFINNATWKNARLNHYRFKTIEEFVMNKMVRRWPTNYLNGGKNGLNLNMFFRFNNKTYEKKNYANYLIDKYNIGRNE